MIKSSWNIKVTSITVKAVKLWTVSEGGQRTQLLTNAFLYLYCSLTAVTGEGLGNSSSLSCPVVLYLEMINGNTEESLFDPIPAELCCTSPR